MVKRLRSDIAAVGSNLGSSRMLVFAFVLPYTVSDLMITNLRHSQIGKKVTVRKKGLPECHILNKSEARGGNYLVPFLVLGIPLHFSPSGQSDSMASITSWAFH